MNFLELCQTARQECGIQGQGPSAVTNQSGVLKKIVDWVAKADLYIQSLHGDWDFLWEEFNGPTVPNSRDIAKPADLGMWDRESFSVDRGTEDGRSLTLIDFKEDRRNYGERIANPPVEIVILPDGNLRLCCPADGIYSIDADYWKKPTVLSADASVPPYPLRFHWAIIERVKMYFYADQEAFELYKEAELRFNEWLNQLEANQLPGQQLRSQAQPDLDMMTVRPG